MQRPTLSTCTSEGIAAEPALSSSSILLASAPEGTATAKRLSQLLGDRNADSPPWSCQPSDTQACDECGGVGYSCRKCNGTGKMSPRELGLQPDSWEYLDGNGVWAPAPFKPPAPDSTKGLDGQRSEFWFEGVRCVFDFTSET